MTYKNVRFSECELSQSESERKSQSESESFRNLQTLDMSIWAFKNIILAFWPSHVFLPWLLQCFIRELY